MTRIVLALIVLVACSSKPAPIAPKAAPANLACQQARTIDKNAACLPLRTAVAGVPDLAIADVGTGILVRCTAGEGMGAGCAAFADLRPRPAAPEASKVDPSKPDAATPVKDAGINPAADKPKADPPKKPEPKK